MPPLPVQIQPPPRAEEPPRHVGDEEMEFVPDLDAYVEHSMCSCNAGDDNPH